ncbi:MAG: hypothetical protein ACKVSF_03985 [Alphaproteobacteria bacterium]
MYLELMYLAALATRPRNAKLRRSGARQNGGKQRGRKVRLGDLALGPARPPPPPSEALEIFDFPMTALPETTAKFAIRVGKVENELPS